jgi:heme oxygenase
MYLALLAGGQIIKRIVRRTLGLSDENGLAIFEFEGVNRKEMKEQFLHNINCMELSRSQKDKIIEEKFLCFQMNNALADSIELRPSSFKRLLFFFLFFVLGLFFILLVFVKFFFL